MYDHPVASLCEIIQAYVEATPDAVGLWPVVFAERGGTILAVHAEDAYIGLLSPIMRQCSEEGSQFVAAAGTVLGLTILAIFSSEGVTALSFDKGVWRKVPDIAIPWKNPYLAAESWRWN